MARTPCSSPFLIAAIKLNLFKQSSRVWGSGFPTPAQLGVGCDWPEPRVVTKKVFGFFLTGQPDCFLFLFLKG